jgi:two-component system, NtrC family, response regulator HydG
MRPELAPPPFPYFPASPMKILLVDDDVSVLEALAQIVTELGHETTAVSDPLAALDLIAAQRPALVITDLRMPGLDGLHLLKRVKDVDASIQVVVISGHAGIDEAVTAMKRGAYDFISKPFNISEIENVVLRALEKAALLDENRQLRASLEANRFPMMSDTRCPAFRELLDSAAQAAGSEATVLVMGESGTGKEVLARYMASRSRRAGKPLVTVNCAAIPENLIESELFGHRKGAFTGAHQDRKGRFEEADGGTIFLDEVGELPLPVQAKLLRVLQEGEISPVGGAPRRVNVRIIAATNKNLRAETTQGRFREDLFYRLNVISFVIPPLRRRLEDLPAFIAWFMARYGVLNGRENLSLSPDALRLMEQYSWPGNVRELENAIERAVILTVGDLVLPRTLPPEVTGDVPGDPGVVFRRGMTLDEIEMMVIQTVLRYNHGDRGRTAEELGIGVRTLYRKLHDLNEEHMRGE